MRMTQLIPALMIASLAALPAAAETFPIKLDRPYAAGQKYELKSSLTDQRSTTVMAQGQERPAQSVTTAFKLEAIVEVLEVDKHGGKTKVKVTIGKFTQLGQGVDETMASEGDIFFGEVKNDVPTFTAEKGPIAPAAATALSGMVSLRRSNVPSTDEAFRTNKPQGVGDSWPMDAEAAAAGLKAMGIPAKKEDVSGKATVKGEKTIDGVECLLIDLDMTVKGLAPPEGKLPAGAKLKDSSIRLQGTMTLPKDVSKLEMADDSQMTTKLVITAPLPDNGGEAEINTTMIRRRTSTYNVMN